jgi:hypothetical protein
MAQYCLSNTLGRPTKRLEIRFLCVRHSCCPLSRPARPYRHSRTRTTARPLAAGRWPLTARQTACSAAAHLRRSARQTAVALRRSAARLASRPARLLLQTADCNPPASACLSGVLPGVRRPAAGCGSVAVCPSPPRRRPGRLPQCLLALVHYFISCLTADCLSLSA